MKKFISLVSIITVVVLCQACAIPKNDLRAETPKANEIKAEAKSDSSTASETAVIEIKAGDNLAPQISRIKVKDTKLKVKSLSSLVANQNTLLILVKPGCIFCESLMAVVDALKPTIKPQMIIVLDAAHATTDEFKQKYNSHSKIKATWVYDYENKFHEELGMNSFPRLIHIDSKQTVLQNQVGLVLPKDLKEQEELKKEPFPVVLQKLSQTTVAWMQSL